jgi:hypothetical protein
MPTLKVNIIPFLKKWHYLSPPGDEVVRTLVRRFRQKVGSFRDQESNLQNLAPSLAAAQFFLRQTAPLSYEKFCEETAKFLIKTN